MNEGVIEDIDDNSSGKSSGADQENMLENLGIEERTDPGDEGYGDLEKQILNVQEAKEVFKSGVESIEKIKS